MAVSRGSRGTGGSSGYRSGAHRRTPTLTAIRTQRPRVRPPTNAPVFTRGPRPLQAALGASPSPVPERPADFRGSNLEWALYAACLRRGMQESVDFEYQSPLFGGRRGLGGLVLDFYFPAQGIGLNPLGAYHHYEQGSQQQALDRAQAAQLASYGIHLIFADEADVLSNPYWILDEALAGRDHSWIGRGAI